MSLAAHPPTADKSLKKKTRQFTNLPSLRNFPLLVVACLLAAVNKLASGAQRRLVYPVD